ncbi:uncharacterized protein TNCV_1049831 [Trichonephila clavipes]|nr:uncharacterized protein TNCV_1049831 [Trichonephila clavipes]
MAPHTITPAVGAVCHCKAKRPSSIPLQSSFLVRGNPPNGRDDGWASRAAHLMGVAIPNVLQLVCLGHPEPGLHVNDISRIHWSQHLLTTQSKRPNGLATHQADHTDSIMPMILPSQTATAAHIVFENGVMACLPQLLLCKQFITLKQAFVTCFIIHGERR